MNIFSIFVLSSILAGVSYASDSLIKVSDAIPVQSSIKLDGFDINLAEVKTPLAEPDDVEPILPTNAIEDDATIDNEGDEIDDEDDESDGEDDESDGEDDESTHDDSSEDGHESSSEEVASESHSEEVASESHSEEVASESHRGEAGGESLNHTTDYMVDDETGEVFYRFEPLPNDVAYDLRECLRSVTNKIHPLFRKPEDLPTLKEAQHAWDLLKEKLAILTPRNAATANLDNLKSLELKITEQLNSVSAESVHQLSLDWADMKELLDGIVKLHWNLIIKEQADRFAKSLESKKKSFLSQFKAWASGTAFPASSDDEGAAARRLLGFLE